MKVEGWILLGVIVLFAFLLGWAIGFSDDEVKTITETKIVYINQSDNCLNEILKTLDERDEIMKAVFQHENYK